MNPTVAIVMALSVCWMGSLFLACMKRMPSMKLLGLSLFSFILLLLIM